MSAGKKKYNRNQPEGIRAITMLCMIVFVCMSFYEVYFFVNRSISIPAETYADRYADSCIHPGHGGAGH